MENKFIKNFILKQKRDRLFFEFQNKRKDAINRFAHNANGVLNSNKIILSGEKLQLPDVKKFLLNYITLTDKVYIISGNENLDKKIMSFNKAIELFFDDYMQMIITDGVSFALIKEEVSGSYSQKYVLIN